MGYALAQDLLWSSVSERYFKSVGAGIRIGIDLSQHLRPGKARSSGYYLQGTPPDDHRGLKYPQVGPFAQGNVTATAEQPAEITADQDSGSVTPADQAEV
jgi:hypothetical protein